LFEHPAAKAWIVGWVAKVGGIEQLRSAAAVSLDQIEDAQVRSIVTEEAQAQNTTIDQTDLKNLLDRRLAKVWARFSQQIKAQIADAEAKQDAGLEKKLKQEYLDVQRKMKEFISFYDEA
jgi:predicted flavoprotein YhiN